MTPVEKILDILGKRPEMLREWGAESPVELFNGVVGFHAKNSPNEILVWVGFDDSDETYSVRITEQEYGNYIQLCFIPERELVPILDRMIKGEIGEEDIVSLQEKWIEEEKEDGTITEL